MHAIDWDMCGTEDKAYSYDFLIVDPKMNPRRKWEGMVDPIRDWHQTAHLYRTLKLQDQIAFVNSGKHDTEAFLAVYEAFKAKFEKVEMLEKPQNLKSYDKVFINSPKVYQDVHFHTIL